MSDFSDFETTVPEAVPPMPKRGAGGDPPPGSGLLSPSEQAASDAFERDPRVAAEREKEIARLRRSSKPSDAVKLKILSDPKANGASLVAASVPASPKGVDFGDFTGGGIDLSPEGIAAMQEGNRREILGDPMALHPGNVAKGVVREAASLGDLVLSIPAQLIGVGADLGMRARAIGGSTPRRAGAQAGVDASQAVMGELGNPLQKLLSLAGMGDDGSGDTSTNKVMAKAADLIAKGGDWVEKNTGGLLLKEDVESIANAAMGAAGGRGIAAGLEKITPAAMRLEGVKFSPYALRRIQEGALREGSPVEAAKAAEATSQAAVDAKTRMTEGKPLSLDPTSGKLEEMIPEMGKELPKPTSLDTALEKLTSDRAWDMTAEERIAYQAWKKLPPERPFVDESGAPLRKGAKWEIDESGKLVAAAGLGTAAYALSPEEQHDAVLATAGAFLMRHGDGRGLSLEEFKDLSPTIPLGTLLARSDYTLKTLDRLGQENIEFSKAHVEQELKRQDVSDPERATVRAALDSVPGARISAKDLLVGVKKATGDFELVAKKTDEYADYGLEGLGRVTEGMRDDMGLDQPWIPDDATPAEEAQLRAQHLADAAAKGGEVEPTTTLYRLPSHMEVSDANHFGDKNLFGWTRSFTEDGVRHVVEIQSDLAQHAKGLSPEARTKVEAELEGAKEAERSAKERAVDAQNVALAASEAANRAANQGGRRALDLEDLRQAARQRSADAQNVHRSAFLTVAELEAKLAEGAGVERLSPIIKNWPKRLVREELGDAAREQADIPRKIEYFETQVGEPQRSAEIDALKKRQSDIVRFATADTVAEVEGWPKTLHPDAEVPGQLLSMSEKFSPQHQSIYDRYKRDVEKFLTKDLGGKPYTDPQGHTWIEVPLPKKGPKQMYGRATPEMLARLAAIGLGATAAQYFSDEKSLLNAVLGGVAGAALSHISPHRAVSGIKSALKADTRLRINQLSDYHERLTKLAAIDIWGLQTQIFKLAPKAASRAKITHAIEAGDLSTLTAEEVKAAKIATDFFDSKLWEGVDSGVLTSARDNYVTHLWDWSRNDRGLLASFLDRSPGSMSPNLAFAKARDIPTLAEGKKLGLVPLTEDIAQIMGIYGNAVTRAGANKGMIDALKHEMTPAVGPQGPARPIPLVSAADKAPMSYVSINHPQFTGLRVHPDIAPSLKMLFDTSSPGAAMKIMQGLSDTVKRVAVSFSLFHAKALIDAMIGGSSNPFKALSRVPGFVAGTSEYLLELQKGSASALVNWAVDSGLMFSLERAGAGVEDAGHGFYASMTALQGFLDKTIPGAGLPIKGLQELNHKVDTFMWARLHAGMKLQMFAEKYQQLLDNSARKGTPLTPEAAGRLAASYTNDLFGGLNWRRIADDAKTKFGADLGHAVLNPGARRINQLLIFAPDWTLSTTRAAVQAFGKLDLLRPTTLAGLHQQYLLRSAVYYLVVGDTINYAMSGHHLWENKDPTVIEMDEKGERKMQWSKHTMEPVHWLMHPGQQALNKLGFIPKELATQALGVEYLSAKGSMPPMQSRVGHLAKALSPIAVQQAQDGGLAPAISGFLGAPIYGKTAEEKKRFREAMKQQRIKKALEVRK